ncbi:MAG: RidA family protein [Rhodospirillales bacterium]|jgi:enamine deaminase RidA (YjgF/YER057c/UK114 family)|nr:RidA family protein [Rhodospirillales bacterium]MBT4007289.1 RidA family protein [Rhodospirillales bacterium]MBT5077006.1 RidA family protein [Rhodospirillales bacterium]MBT5113622.1 RidA family protein [Rhodospirillales bacterium]MBT5673920.1 RidA family protein [Rhodospirillales bacterium]
MAKREVIDVPALGSHGDNPIPALVRVGDMVFSGGISGRNGESGDVPEDAADQVANAFTNIRLAMEAAGGSTDDIAKVTVYVRDKAVREHLNPEWVKMFPDAKSRPVRHVLTADIPKRLHLQLEIIAVL